MRFKTALSAALAFLVVSLARSAESTAFPPRDASLTPLTAEELFRPTTLGQAELSPDGRHLGAVC